MATKGLRELRHKYKAAYTSYMHCVQLLSDASHAGVWPPEDVLELEKEVFAELTLLRRALLDALYAQSQSSTKAAQNSK
jgi:hypothetical protein